MFLRPTDSCCMHLHVQNLRRIANVTKFEISCLQATDCQSDADTPHNAGVATSQSSRLPICRYRNGISNFDKLLRYFPETCAYHETDHIFQDSTTLQSSHKALHKNKVGIRVGLFRDFAVTISRAKGFYTLKRPPPHMQWSSDVLLLQQSNFSQSRTC